MNWTSWSSICVNSSISSSNEGESKHCLISMSSSNFVNLNGDEIGGKVGVSRGINMVGLVWMVLVVVEVKVLCVDNGCMEEKEMNEEGEKLLNSFLVLIFVFLF